jgi:multiple sugar transport system substrate-binding protein
MKRLRRTGVTLAVIGALVSLGACASPGGSSGTGVSDADKYGTKAHPITLSFWSWGGGDPAALEAAYLKVHPYVDINLTEFGGAGDVYTKLGVAFKAGKGAPDLSGMELMNMPSFAAGGNLADLVASGGQVKDFDGAAIAASKFNGKLYAIPTDTGPLVLYYNKTLFDSVGIKAPTTWAEYKDDAIALKAAGKGYIANMDPGDPSWTLGLLQQLDSHPFTLKGTSDLNVNLADAGATKFANYWTDLLKEGLVKSEPQWSSQWFNELADGTYASWISGAWGGSVLSGSIPAVKGDWRVVPLPNWDSGKAVSGLWGGSGTVVTQQSKHKAAATAFAEWFSVQQFIDGLPDAANKPFPASLEVLNNPLYDQAVSEFMGGQKPGALYKEASKSVNPDWQYLPFQLYANTIYKDTAGQHIDGDHDIAAGFKAWQEKIVDYGKQQGFKVTTK